MALTPAQLPALKAAIEADVALNAQPRNSDGYLAIANAMNLPASPAYLVFRTDVTMREVGDNLNGTELAGLTTANHTRLQTIAILSTNGINAALGDRRRFFSDVFSGAGGTTTRASLVVVFRRACKRGERLYVVASALNPEGNANASGARGTAANPDTLVFEGNVTPQDVEAALA